MGMEARLGCVKERMGSEVNAVRRELAQQCDQGWVQRDGFFCCFLVSFCGVGGLNQDLVHARHRQVLYH